jgi:hypothetical protein
VGISSKKKARKLAEEEKAETDDADNEEKAQHLEAKAGAWSAKKAETENGETAESDGVQAMHEGADAEALGQWSRQRSRPCRRRRRYDPLVFRCGRR